MGDSRQQGHSPETGFPQPHSPMHAQAFADHEG